VYKSASWCAYMQSNYLAIERTIYRQLDAESCYLNDDFQRN